MAGAALCMGVGTAVVRYLGLNGFSNDHYLYLARAQQMLMGAWPTRDFFDPGAPLAYVASAGMQLLFGRTLLAEAVLVAVAFGLAAAAVVVAAWRASGSLVVGIAASLLTILAFPRPYGYPKFLLLAVAPLVIWAWIRHPTTGRLAAMAAFVAIASLFRHDFGIGLSAAAFATIALTPAADRGGRWRRSVAFGGLLILFLLPYVAYVQIHEGLLPYLQDAIAFSQREADRTRLSLSAIVPGDEARLYYLFQAVPVVALAWLVADHRQWSTIDILAVPLVVTAMFANAVFLRDPLAARLPDVVVPCALVAAWLAGRSMRVRHRVARVASLIAIVLTASLTARSISVIGKAGEQLARTNLWTGIGEIPRLFRDKRSELTKRFARTQWPDGRLVALVPFFEYLDRCTIPRHHLLVAGNAPEVYVYAQRPFAAGQAMFIEGYFQSEREQERQLLRAQRQVIAFALLLSDQYRDWRRGFARLNAFLESRFRPLTDIPIDEERTIRILVHAGLPPTHIDAATGWPCFR